MVIDYRENGRQMRWYWFRLAIKNPENMSTIAIWFSDLHLQLILNHRKGFQIRQIPVICDDHHQIGKLKWDFNFMCEPGSYFFLARELIENGHFKTLLKLSI